MRYFDTDDRLVACMSCQVGADVFFVTAAYPVSYEFDSWSLGSGLSDAPGCADSPASVAYGFGPVTGTLTPARRAWCQVLPVRPGDRFRVSVQSSAAVLPAALMLSPDGTALPCDYAYDPRDGYSCTPRFASGQTRGAAVIAVTADATAPVPFTVQASCATGLCDGNTYSLHPAEQINVTAGRKATFEIAGTSLHTGDTVRLTRAGHASIPGTVRSVSANRYRMTVEADFAKAAPGKWNIVGASYSSASRTAQLNNLVNVLPMPKIVVKAKPSVVGKAAVGLRVRATTGTWSVKPASVRYQWTADGVAIKGATGSAYTIPASLRGKRIAVIVTARAAGHTDTASSSAAVTVGYGVVPKATKKPSISGTVKAGKTVKVKVGAWSPSATSYKYVWRVDGKVVGTGSKVKLKKSWKGKKLTVTVTAKRAGHYDGKATSKALKIK
ncbi:hypothetical protein [Actinoplanes missouriensis]|uniref:hypothetical protein n=1 Tax=Actinoplanes missouriensis TaxID=1866 RepID=UPI0012F943D3|nr:hypothetical protein [Actinoplanes missouriensis]